MQNCLTTQSRCNLCAFNAPHSLHTDLRRMNVHRTRSHGTSFLITSEELGSLERCQANKSGPKNSYEEVKSIAAPQIQDFRSQSLVEHKMGFVRFALLFNDDEDKRQQSAKEMKEQFHAGGPNPYFDQVLELLNEAEKLCRMTGCELLRQQVF